jgi:hypothetical protein
MADKPVNVDGVRRLVNVSPEDMGDHDLRVALARLAAEYEADKSAEEAAQRARTVADALNRLEPL